MTTSTAITVAASTTARVGEGPFWDPSSRTLVWVDILAGHIHRSDIGTGETTTIAVPWLVGAAVPRKGGGYVAATTDGFAEVDLDGSTRVRHALLDAEHRMNDAVCDPRGRLWAGSVHTEFRPSHGALHVLHPDWTTTKVLDGLTQPNGMVWNAAGTELLVVDSQERQILALDVDPDTATIHGSRIAASFESREGYPDGMCLDDEGTLWVAMWAGRQLIRCTTNGSILDRLPMPVSQPSSCTFGGPDLSTLYVTSAAEGLPLREDTLDGYVLAVTGLGISGPTRPMFAG